VSCPPWLCSKVGLTMSTACLHWSGGRRSIFQGNTTLVMAASDIVAAEESCDISLYSGDRDDVFAMIFLKGNVSLIG
jgi:hypothetical protein